METSACFLLRELSSRGFAHLRSPLQEDEFRHLAAHLGLVVNEEDISLRFGAHAYVARPGKVPLHTDHPEVAIIGWRCDRQDHEDGASLLLDTRPILDALSNKERDTLRQVDLACPHLDGGPPVLSHPVLRPRVGPDAVFCSPWLRSAQPIPILEAALNAFRARLSEAETRSTIRIRLAPGEVLLVDNQRVLHGRGAIHPRSPRRLLRLWIRDPSLSGLLHLPPSSAADRPSLQN